MIYYTFALIATMFAWLSVHVKGRKLVEINGRTSIKPQRGLIVLSFLVYFIPSAIRYGIGQDYFYTYEPMFNHIVKDAKSIYTNKLIGYSEVGFTALNKLIGVFTDNAQWLFVITSLISLVLVYICIYDYSPCVPLSVFMLVLGSYYMGSYALVRQSMAIAIFAYSLRYVEKRNPIKYGICMVIAALLHTASLIYIPFYFIGTKKITKKQYLLFSVGIIVGLNVFGGVVSRIVAMTRFSNRINFNSDYNYLLSLVVLIVFYVGVYGLSEKDEDESYRVYLNVMFVSACLIGVSKFLDTSDRIIYGFYYTNFITIPYFISRGRFGKYKSLVVLGLFLSLFVLWSYEHLYYDQFYVIPYVSIFSK